MRIRHCSVVGCLILGAAGLGCGGQSSGNNNGGDPVSTGGTPVLSTLPNGGGPLTGGTSSGNTVIATTSVGGTGGFAATEPVSTVVGPPTMDVLLMVDNSASMADKQQLLAASVPRLIERLVQPDCVDSAGAVVGKSQLGVCAQGSVEFTPVKDLHIGVVTSSLGDHGGGTLCTPGKPTPFTDSMGDVISEPDDVNDQAHLMGTLARGAGRLAGDASVVQSASIKLDTAGFLGWSTAAGSPTPGDLISAGRALSDMVAAAGETGCGLEAQLESWFRFLIDPVPPIMPIQMDGSQAQRTGSDDALLLQRAVFLRPNSTLAIVMLTDEDDCSLRDTDVGWVATDTRHSILTGSAQCDSNPNDKCCYSCTTSPPSGCAAGCPASAPAAIHDSPYQANIRCWQQKRRFGYEFMYPASRYVVGLTKPRLCPDQTFGDMDCDCTFAKSIGAQCAAGTRNLPNPLYANVIGTDNSGRSVLSAAQVAPRADNSSIFLVGILGVPWQDVGYIDANGNLTYIPVTDPVWTSGAPAAATPVTAAPNGIWANIYGDDNSNVVPQEPHMVASLVPRQGLPGPTAAADADPISGHEWNTAMSDFEYACIFKLPTPRACACSVGDVYYASCKYLHTNDCCDLSYSVDGEGNPGGDFDKPLCNGSTQVAAKAYPGLREIAVLRHYAQTPIGVQGNSVVASICARDVSSDPSTAGYGYNPAVEAIVARMKAANALR